MNETACHTLWVMRHGHRQDFADLDWPLTAEHPDDPGLSPEGIEQARLAGARLAGEAIRRIFCSPYLRCAETAHLANESLQIPIHLEPGLGELNQPGWGKGEHGLRTTEILVRATGAFEPHEPIAWPAFPEPMEGAFMRCAAVARELAAAFAGPLLLVTHAVGVMGIVRELTRFEGEIPSGVASLTCLERAGHRAARRGGEPTEPQDRWTLVLNCDTSHLSRT